MKKLNGWQRLWLVLCFVWWASILTITAYEYNSSKNGWFSGLSLPVGTVFTENYVKLPNGREIPIDIEIEGKTIEPWEIKWDNEPEIPTIQFFNWQALIVTSLLPLFLVFCFFSLAAYFHGCATAFARAQPTILMSTKLIFSTNEIPRHQSLSLVQCFRLGVNYA